MATATVPYDQREGFIWFNGDPDPVGRRAAACADPRAALRLAVFEGMRAYDGEIFKLTEHNQRLHKSAQILDFDIPYSVAELDKAAREVVRANKLTDAYVRPIAWRGSEQMGVSAQQTQHQCRHRRLGLGLLFRSGRARRRAAPEIRRVPPARSQDRADR